MLYNCVVLKHNSQLHKETSLFKSDLRRCVSWSWEMFLEAEMREFIPVTSHKV